MKPMYRISTFFVPIALIGFGVTTIVQQNFLKGPFPIHLFMPWRAVGSDALGLILLGLGILMFLSTTALQAYGGAAALFGAAFFFPHLPLLLGDIHNGSQWTGALEVLCLAAGIYMVRPGSGGQENGWLNVVCKYLFAVCLVAFGIQHFQYAAYIASLIPRWIPFKGFCTFVTRFGFILAGLSLMLNVMVRLAMNLLGLMFLIWVAVLHLPRAVTILNVEPEWTSMFIAVAISGLAFTIASCVDVPKKEGVLSKADQPIGYLIE